MIEPQIFTHRTNTRRSQRVVASIRVNILREEGTPSLLSEDTQTLVVNAHGALLTLAMSVQPGDGLTMKNSISSEQAQIRVVRVGETQPSPKEVAVEFTSPAPRFWHIDFPPADWEMLQDE